MGLADDPHTQALAEGDELVEEVVGLEPLRHGQDGGELAAGPGTQEVPVAHVRQCHDNAAGAHVLVQLGVEVRAHAREDFILRDSGESEGLVEVAHIGAHPRA